MFLTPFDVSFGSGGRVGFQSFYKNNGRSPGAFHMGNGAHWGGNSKCQRRVAAGLSVQAVLIDTPGLYIGGNRGNPLPCFRRSTHG